MSFVRDFSKNNNEDLSPQVIDNFNSVLQKLTSASLRAFAAEICIEYFESSPTKMECHKKGGREKVKLEVKEQLSRIECLDAYTLRGTKKKNRIFDSLNNFYKISLLVGCLMEFQDLNKSPVF